MATGIGFVTGWYDLVQIRQSASWVPTKCVTRLWQAEFVIQLLVAVQRN